MQFISIRGYTAFCGIVSLCAAGMNPNMNVSCMEVGGLAMKEPPQPQSRLSQWTHPHSMESLSGNSSPLEPNLGKHGTETSRILAK